MRRSKEDTAATRELILETAATEFRKNGLQVGVADLMSSAGLTHGGFYRHFESKDELVSEACESALNDIIESLGQSARKASADSALRVLVKKYLSTHHRDHPETGCALAGLGSEMTRSTEETREVGSEGIKGLARLIESLLPEGETQPEAEALFILSSMVGGLMLSRIMPDRAASNRLLGIVSDQITEKYLKG